MSALTVYVDALREYSKRPGLWCHMVADDLDQLHEMADRIGIPRNRFQNRGRNPHYDLNPERREAALRAGAVEASKRRIVEVLRAHRQARRLACQSRTDARGDAREEDT